LLTESVKRSNLSDKRLNSVVGYRGAYRPNAINEVQRIARINEFSTTNCADKRI